MNKFKDIKKSFICAFNGLKFVINNERNFKIHIILAIYVLYFSRYYNLSKSDYVVLMFVIALVMCLEIVNTIVEIIVDFLSPAYSLFAKKTKDIAAGGVLVSSIFALIIGLIYFFNLDIIIFIMKDILFNWEKLLVFLLSLIGFVIFIFSGEGNKSRNINK